MPDAGPLDPRCELTADLLGDLGSDSVAEEGGDVFGFDSEDGLPGKLLIERFEDGWRAEHQIRGVFDLHETPMVGLSKHVEHRTALLGVPIEDATQHVGREAIGKGLRALPVVDAQESVVGQGETDPGGGELAGQPAMPVAIELEAERTPCRHAQIDQTQFGVDEVEVVVQAFAGIRPQERAMRLFVVPGLVGVAGFHRRDDMDQAGMVAAHGKDLGDDVFLANVLLGNVFDGDASRTGQFGSAVAHAITKRFGKSRIVEDPDLPRRKKPHHPFRIAGPGQRAGDDDPVVAGEHPGEALAVTLRQQLPQPPLPLRALLRLYYPVWFRLRRLREKLVDDVIAVCGGHFRDLLRLLRDTVVGATPLPTLPVPPAVIAHTINAARRDFLPIAQDDARWLAEIARVRATALPSTEATPVNRLARFLDSHFV